MLRLAQSLEQLRLGVCIPWGFPLFDLIVSERLAALHHRSATCCEPVEEQGCSCYFSRGRVISSKRFQS